MKLKYPQLAMCSKCRRHGMLLITEHSKSMGFMTKQTGWAIINNYYEQKWITEEQYQQLYQAISESSLAHTDDFHTTKDEITMMRMVYIYTETQKGARLLEPYFPCGDKDPVMIRGTQGKKINASLN